MRRLASPALGIFLCVFAVSAMAAVPTFWRLESQSDFLSGDTDGISIASDGTMSLAPAAQTLFEGTDPQFWSLASDSEGNIYVGSGNEGKVYKVDSAGTGTVLIDTKELQVHALAVDRRNNIYVGTSPRGVVHRVSPDGTQEIFFEPEERYIWALAVDSLHNVIVATGDSANVYRVSPAGESEVLFASQETHIVSLAIDGDDNIYAGSDANGLVFKIDVSGGTSVLYDTPFQEVRRMVVDTRGNVYAVAVNGSGSASSRAEPSAPTPASSSPSTPVSTGEATVTVTTSASAMVVASPSVSPAVSSGSAKGALFRISGDGVAEQLWQSQQDTPMSLALARDDRIVVGTGGDGRIYLVQQDKTSSLLLSVQADQVTAILPGSGGQSFVSTSNPAKLYRLNAGRRTEGRYRSETKDTETMSSWGRIRWEARTPAGTVVKLQTRSGNSAEPDNTWSEWSQPYTSSDGEQISSPRGRFFQWRAVLNSTGDASPELLDVTAIYLQQNLPPEVTEITVHTPGQTFQKPLVTTGQFEILGMTAAIVEDQSPSANGTNNAAATTAQNMALLSRPMYRKGFQTVTWTASDPNDDELRFDVQYRAEGESLWRTLREGLTGPVIAWDTVAMPDGRYSLKVVASDSLSNPKELARTGEKISRTLEVDNGPPQITNLAVEPGTSSHRVSFSTRDAISPIRHVEYAVNSGDWTVVFPVDGIADSPLENFDFELEGFRDGGVYTLVVKVSDTLGNTGTARAELR